MKFLAVCGVLLIGSLIIGVVGSLTGITEVIKDVSIYSKGIYHMSYMFYGMAIAAVLVHVTRGEFE